MTRQWRLISSVGLLASTNAPCADAFAPPSNGNRSLRQPQTHRHRLLHAKKNSKGGGGFGGGGFGSAAASSNQKKKKKKKKGSPRDLLSALDDDGSQTKKDGKAFSRTYVKSDQERLLDELAAKSSGSAIGRAVSTSPDHDTPDADPFWQLLPSLIATKFPTASDDDLARVARMVEFSLGARGLLEDDVVSDEWRPHEELVSGIAIQ